MRQAPLLSGPTEIMRGSVAIDGHCHLELLRQRVSSKATIESALEALAECHASTVLAGSEAEVTISVFQNELTARMPASVGTI